MSKQTQQASSPSSPSNANTAENGCGNGFSLIQALTTPSPSSSSATTRPQSQAIAAAQTSMTRAELLAVLQDVLEMTADFDDDEPASTTMANNRDIPTLLSQ